ncbi:MAG TPA: hypothetical protein DCX46_10980, partial [Bacteroidetes bacterium]|nr:hypothetical protein [Bacteroidota bacterium]
MAVFPGMQGLLKGIQALHERRIQKFTVYSPVPHHDIEHALHRGKSPVRMFTLVGAVLGFCTGWA